MALLLEANRIDDTDIDAIFRSSCVALLVILVNSMLIWRGAHEEAQLMIVKEIETNRRNEKLAHRGVIERAAVVIMLVRRARGILLNGGRRQTARG